MTGRLPFDPAKMRAPRREEPALSVSALAARIEGALRERLGGTLLVTGELSGLTDRTHWYFSLKDAEAVVSCVMFASAARRQAHRPRDGEQVLARGRVEFYAPGGRLTFVVERIDPVGLGELERRYRALCEELRGLGWFDPERKRALPSFPRRVGVVTSRVGAALQDVIDTARRRCPAVELVVADTRVQGEAAAGDVARAVRELASRREELRIDAILITRGGGSLEDLWAFNDRRVAEAIVGCPVPVVAAIGHETDTTIAELVADERCATPTQAAMRLTPDRGALDAEVGALGRRLAASIERRLVESSRGLVDSRRRLRQAVASRRSGAGERTERLSSRLAHCSPRAVLARRDEVVRGISRRLRGAARERLERERRGDLGLALVTGMRRRLESQRGMLDARVRHLEAVGPLSVLRRGFSCTFDGQGRLLRSVRDVAPGDRIVTQLADGVVESRVSGRGDDGQLDLFGSSG